MPLEKFHGSDFSELLSRARAALGEDAVILSVRRGVDIASGQFELVAADPATAAVARPGPSVAPGMNAIRPLARYRPGQPLLVALVGPTGAGKTTTIAKIANHPQIFGGWPAGLLCLDTYRIGALEQLRMVAELSGLPLDMAYTPDEVPAALQRLSGCEVILVDTAGRGPRQSSEIEALLRPLRGVGPLEVHLVLPAGLRPELARRFIAHHKPLGPTHLVVTKLDEYPDDEHVFALSEHFGLGMRWACDGQDVPHDVHAAATKRPRAEALEL